MAKAKLLHLPNFVEPFIAVTDAAKGQFACWAIYQRHKVSKNLVPIIYGSQCFRLAMAQWSQYKAEAYAAIKCLKDNINLFPVQPRILNIRLRLFAVSSEMGGFSNCLI